MNSTIILSVIVLALAIGCAFLAKQVMAIAKSFASVASALEIEQALRKDRAKFVDTWMRNLCKAHDQNAENLKALAEELGYQWVSVNLQPAKWVKVDQEPKDD